MFSCSGEKSLSQDDYKAKRDAMVENQLKARDITDQRVLQAMSNVPRHLFVPAAYRSDAYGDHPLPIGFNQTISQPYIVALMTQLMELKGNETVLEIGTGSGYQAAVLSELCDSVCTIEIVPELAESAAKRLVKLGYDNVNIYCGDGYIGWYDRNIEFDAIIITAAPPKVPQALLDQLKDGCRLVVPEGKGFQYLRVYIRKSDRFEKQNIIPVRFVPMIHGEN